MALKILVILVVCTLASSLPEPGVNINVNVNVVHDGYVGDGSDNSHNPPTTTTAQSLDAPSNSFLFCGVDFNPSGSEYLSYEQQQQLLLMKLSQLPDYCDEPIPPPFNNPSVEDIEFRLYDSTTNNYSRLITNDPGSVDSSSLNSSLPLIVVAHGWTEDADTAMWMYQIKDQWLEKMPINVILVQWKKLAANYIFPLAVYNARFVGTELAALLNFLESYTGLSPSNTHIIGFSLGAQIAGVAGHQLDNLSRITGLDPAGPLFNGAPLSERLDASDADFVDVIHTNSGGFGFINPCGHVDFYMNGGYIQNGCQILVGNFPMVVCDKEKEIDSACLICSHASAHAYYVESFTTPEPSYGYLCEDQTMLKDGLCLNNPNNTVGYGVTPYPAGVFLQQHSMIQ